ncbi:putative membrane protein precursor [Clostridioides difficile R20291]|uniref:Membrane protein n=3 Tax=Clostridioides difficile TaxID=1496 RepID=A0A9R0BL29_CLODR|nr:putative membrane protein precursor [Clostridioides difficile CD196]CBE05041.1 putative membrane protein precursor [Clostridioides difficile R20291]
MSKKTKYFSLILFPIALLLNFIASKVPNIVEKYYSQFIDKIIVQILSKVSGIFPFSLYEITMYIIVISIFLFLCCTLSTIFNKKKNVLWGINYNRIPLETTLINNYNLKNNTSIQSKQYSVKELTKLYKFLVIKANETRKLTLQDKNGIVKSNTDYNGVINRAQLGYDNILDILPSVSGSYSKPKYIISSNLMCYTGITGIYFPFTGEANVNIAIPDLYIPCTVEHEIAHQRGFASEDEANFIAYLTSIKHPHIDFNYSGYILALNYTASALSKVDYNAYVDISAGISDSVRRDLKNESEFWQKYEGKINEISNEFNNSYLKANGVTEGTQSYGKMVDLLLTYYELYPYN